MGTWPRGFQWVAYQSVMFLISSRCKVWPRWPESNSIKTVSFLDNCKFVKEEFGPKDLI
ncbi:hypothetical protein E2C01_074480 [Portunus trituberculatus]|uniref:Uncharacterized protein n=1 Tax=Portunus trituberculatus TaxID=210409 RepID=A0A5B7IC88_PORTR|nr:hypothetical protein [Portunus trituberculatus]